MIRTYELTDQEYQILMDVLEYAANNAVLGESQVQCKTLRQELLQQYESQDGKPITDGEQQSQ